MSHEHRIPDPTLDAHARGPGPFAHVVVIGDRYADPQVAHRATLTAPHRTLTAACGAHRGRHAGDWTPWPTDHARWTARPCRRCFPGAPTPLDHADTRLYWQAPHP